MNALPVALKTGGVDAHLLEASLTAVGTHSDTALTGPLCVWCTQPIAIAGIIMAMLPPTWSRMALPGALEALYVAALVSLSGSVTCMAWVFHAAAVLLPAHTSRK